MIIIYLAIYFLLNLAIILFTLLFFGDNLVRLDDSTYKKVSPYKGWETAVFFFCFPLYAIIKIILTCTDYYDLDEEDTKSKKLFKEQEKQKKENNKLFNKHNKIIQEEIVRTEEYLKSLKKCKL